MNIREFKYQEKQTKKILLASSGVFIGKRNNEEFSIYLFQMHTFYVEMYFDEEENQIGYIRAFTSVDELKPYLDAIDISDIYSILSA
jgi:hypothetical protein